jgi:hypothetical protein
MHCVLACRVHSEPNGKASTERLPGLGEPIPCPTPCYFFRCYSQANALPPLSLHFGHGFEKHNRLIQPAADRFVSTIRRSTAIILLGRQYFANIWTARS